jgi:hypothetical protein
MVLASPLPLPQGLWIPFWKLIPQVQFFTDEMYLFRYENLYQQVLLSLPFPLSVQEEVSVLRTCQKDKSFIWQVLDTYRSEQFLWVKTIKSTVQVKN